MSDIAVIGAGISGLSAAYVLSRQHRVWLIEKDQRLGGHTHTVVVPVRGGRLALDTGFLVHNERTYPNLVRLFREIGVATRDSDMSFSVSHPSTGFEYSSRGARGFFAQPANWISPRHVRLFREIVRFNAEAPALLRTPGAEAITLGEFLDSRRFSRDFAERYLFPLASAVWSASCASIREFPALTLIRFFDNHGFLRLAGQPIWKVVEGGSHSYVPKLVAPLGDRVILQAGLTKVHRAAAGVTLSFAERPAMTVDQVVFACHGDDVLPLLAEPTPLEREVFGGFTTSANVAWLHTDASWLPRRSWARASWNYRLGESDQMPAVTYDLNRLQGLRQPEQYSVTLNPPSPIDPARVIGRYEYRHPQYTRAAIASQGRWAEVSGVNRTHYCGAYWFYGFHEDGFVSALRVARSLGASW